MTVPIFPETESTQQRLRNWKYGSVGLVKIYLIIRENVSTNNPGLAVT
jgi:hypothetical protein